ncbi:MAG TPA: hypothetical protein VJ044_10930 [Candidatus Hodarchaeales archaeon]|nr:hypothetical protein [Candidatus Hodarchaeales archaeon]
MTDIRRVDDHLEFVVRGNELERVAICDIMDEPLIYTVSWCLGKNGKYVVGKHKGKHVSFHRLVCPCIEGTTVDHINRNTLDNRRSNLRPASARMQNINQIRNSGKELPPGVRYSPENNTYFATWANKDGHKKQYAFSCAMWTDDRARSMALEARMAKMISIEDYRNGLFDKEAVMDRANELNLLQNDNMEDWLMSLKDRGCNLWEYVYGGQYASLANNDTAWTAEKYRKEALKRVNNVFDTLKADFSDDELLRRCEGYFNDLWHFSNHHAPDILMGGAKKKRSKADIEKVKSAIDPLLASSSPNSESIIMAIDTVVSSSGEAKESIRAAVEELTAAQRDRKHGIVESIAPFLEPNSILTEDLLEMISPSAENTISSLSLVLPKGSPSIRLIEEAVRSKTREQDAVEEKIVEKIVALTENEDKDIDMIIEENASDALRDGIDALDELRQEARGKNVLYDGLKIVGQAVGKMEKMVNPPISIEKKPRKFAPDPQSSIKNWSMEKLTSDNDTMLDCKHAHDNYLQWCVTDSINRGKGAGYISFLHYMKEYGYSKVSKACFENTKLLGF